MAPRFPAGVALSSPAPSRRGLRTFTVVAALAAGLSAVLVAGGPASADQPADAACTEKAGVAVVVDFTDVGGEVELGCATGDIQTGRDALVAAGFTPEDSQPGMICAIDAHPNPCPEEFTGSFWSYWHADNGEWVSYTVGADSSAPEPGDVEGWRYFDGSAGPTLDPATAIASLETTDATGQAAPDSSEQNAPDQAATNPEAPDPAPTASATDDAEATDASDDGLPDTAIAAIVDGAAVVVAVIAVLVATLRRRGGDE